MMQASELFTLARDLAHFEVLIVYSTIASFPRRSETQTSGDADVAETAFIHKLSIPVSCL
jgi:hypothetical protein